MIESVKESPKLWKITLYLFLVSGVLYYQPKLVFDEDGRIRPFGTRRKTSTVFPLWLWIIGLAIISYLTIFWAVQRA